MSNKRALTLPRRCGLNGQPAKGNDTLSEVYTIPKESFLRRYGKRIAGGIACAAVVSFFMHLPFIKMFILWCCKIILLIFGQPPGHDAIPAIKKHAEQAIVKGKEIIRERKPAIPKLAVPRVIVPKATPEIHVFNETAKRIEGVEKGMDKLAQSGQGIAKAIDKTGDKAKKGIESTGARITKKLHDRKEAKEKEHYDKLIVRARAAQVAVDKSWSLARLDAEVNAAEDAAWHKRYNAQCPRCHQPTRIRKEWRYERFLCSRCQFPYSAGTARALGAPPRQRPGSWRFP